MRYHGPAMLHRRPTDRRRGLRRQDAPRRHAGLRWPTDCPPEESTRPVTATRPCATWPRPARWTTTCWPAAATFATVRCYHEPTEVGDYRRRAVAASAASAAMVSEAEACQTGDDPLDFVAASAAQMPCRDSMADVAPVAYDALRCAAAACGPPTASPA